MIDTFTRPETMLYHLAEGDISWRSLFATGKTLFKNRFPIHPLFQDYFSAVPYAFGDKAVKYLASPCNGEKHWCEVDGFDCMRKLMMDSLNRKFRKRLTF